MSDAGDNQSCCCCGSPMVHSRSFLKPTAECASYFRSRIQQRESEGHELRQRVLELEKDKARLFKLVVACSPFVRIAKQSNVYFSVLEKNIAVDLCDQLDAIRDAE